MLICELMVSAGSVVRLSSIHRPSSSSNIFKHLKNRSIEAIFHVEPPWVGETNVFSEWSVSRDQDGRHAYIW